MPLYFIAITVIALAIFALLYGVGKTLWWLGKLLSLRRRLKKLSKYSLKNGVSVRFLRSILPMPLGKPGQVNFTIQKGEKRCDVAVLSCISTRGRWNFEKARNHCYLVVNRYNRWFYNNYNNSGPEPEMAKDHRRESKFCRVILQIDPAGPEKPSEGETIFLVCPKPKMLTYTDTHLEEIVSGDTVFGHRVLFEGDFFALFDVPPS